MFGISLKEEYFSFILDNNPPIDFLEIHAENYFYFDASRNKLLYEINQHYSLSIHSVGLSLGSSADLDLEHLNQLKKLCDKIEPILISDHLSWSKYNNFDFNDLLPLIYDDELLNLLASKINKVQNILGRKIAIENPARYIDFCCSKYDETDFINKLIDKTNCYLLMDLNNLLISSHNLKFNPIDYINKINPDNINEIHIAGSQFIKDKNIFIDTHNCHISDELLNLFRATNIANDKYILYEWDNNLPNINIYLDEIKNLKLLSNE